MGSSAFYAPEMLNNQPYSPASADMWSFGCVLLELVTGHLKFKNTWMPCYDEAEDARPEPFYRNLEGAVEVMLNQHPVQGTQLGVTMTSLLQVKPSRRVSARALAFCFTPEEAEEEERRQAAQQQVEEEKLFRQRSRADSGAAAAEESKEGWAGEGGGGRGRARGGRSLSPATADSNRGDVTGGSMSHTPATSSEHGRAHTASAGGTAKRSSPSGGGFTRTFERGNGPLDMLPPLVELVDSGLMFDDSRGSRGSGTPRLSEDCMLEDRRRLYKAELDRQQGQQGQEAASGAASGLKPSPPKSERRL